MALAKATPAPQDLPDEVILAITARLAFSDLKSTSLLSKAWHVCASNFLFANISVSPNNEDLEIFEAITQHPLLSTCVRHLLYDGSEFLLHLSKHQYLEELWRQRPSVGTIQLNQTGFDMLHSSDRGTSVWKAYVVQNKMGAADIEAKFNDAKFVSDGYRKYHAHAIYQHKCFQDGKLLRRLVQGLQRLKKLVAVTLESGWDPVDMSFEPRKGGRLARNWSIFHCSPQSWNWGPRTNRPCLERGSDGAEHYCILVSALAQAQRRIRTFQTGSDSRSAVPPYVFDRSRNTYSTMPVRFHDDNLTAFSGLEELSLRFSTYTEAETSRLFKNISGFPALFRSMDHLKGLELRLSGANYKQRPAYYTYDQVFPKDMRWDSMERLGLFQMSIGATDLISLVLSAMPGLKYLELGEIILSEGSWRCVFESFKQMRRLCAFQIPCDTTLYHDGDPPFPGSYRIIRTELYDKISTYVVHGGRHPSLRSRQPGSAAKEYTRDLEPALQQRLIDLDGPSSEVEVEVEVEAEVEDTGRAPPALPGAQAPVVGAALS